MFQNNVRAGVAAVAIAAGAVPAQSPGRGGDLDQSPAPATSTDTGLDRTTFDGAREAGVDSSTVVAIDQDPPRSEPKPRGGTAPTQDIPRDPVSNTARRLIREQLNEAGLAKYNEEAGRYIERSQRGDYRMGPVMTEVEKRATELKAAASSRVRASLSPAEQAQFDKDATPFKDKILAELSNGFAPPAAASPAKEKPATPAPEAKPTPEQAVASAIAVDSISVAARARVLGTLTPVQLADYSKELEAANARVREGAQPAPGPVMSAVESRVDALKRAATAEVVKTPEEQAAFSADPLKFEAAIVAAIGKAPVPAAVTTPVAPEPKPTPAASPEAATAKAAEAKEAAQPAPTPAAAAPTVEELRSGGLKKLEDEVAGLGRAQQVQQNLQSYVYQWLGNTAKSPEESLRRASSTMQQATEAAERVQNSQRYDAREGGPGRSEGVLIEDARKGITMELEAQNKLREQRLQSAQGALAGRKIDNGPEPAGRLAPFNKAVLERKGLTSAELTRLEGPMTGKDYGELLAARLAPIPNPLETPEAKRVLSVNSPAGTPASAELSDAALLERYRTLEGERAKRTEELAAMRQSHDGIAAAARARMSDPAVLDTALTTLTREAEALTTMEQATAGVRERQRSPQETNARNAEIKAFKDSTIAAISQQSYNDNIAVEAISKIAKENRVK